MSEKLRADIGQSQEPPPDDRGRSTEEDDLMTFDEYLDAFDRDTESMYSWDSKYTCIRTYSISAREHPYKEITKEITKEI